MKNLHFAILLTVLIAADCYGRQFSNLDFENMGTEDGFHYSSSDWTIQYGTYPDKNINMWNVGFASEAYLQRGNIDYSFDPSLASLNGTIIGGNNSYFLWGALPGNPSTDPEFEIAQLYQTGTVPFWANYIIFEYRNDMPDFSVGGQFVELQPIAPGMAAAPVSGFQGKDAEIRFYANRGVRTMFDNIVFSADLTVPEPNGAALTVLGAIGMASWARFVKRTKKQ